MTPSDAVFVFDSFDLSGDESVFRYQLGDHRFEEVVRLPPASTSADAAQLEAALLLAHLCIGVSYYKLTAPPMIEVRSGALTEADVDVVGKLYDHGLREFAVTNGLPVPREVRLTADRVTEEPDVGGRTVPFGAPLVPVGGGKDSAVVLAALPDSVAVTVNPTPASRRLVEAAGVPLLEVHRRLDPTLADLTRAGGLNGHVPVTSIHSSLATVVAVRAGLADVVLGNERSASECTRVVEGAPVNHQYSKSYEFEVAFAAAAAQAGVRYFSLLRQRTELGIAALLAGQAHLRAAFLSCNRGFTLDHYRRQDPSSQGWCLDCAKCRFTFLVFTPFLPKADILQIFGGNPLDDPTQVAGFRSLWREDDKPFDCVGERAEAAVAMAALVGRTEWAADAVVRELAEEARAAGAASGTNLSTLLEPSGPALVPPEYVERLRALRPVAVAPV